MSGSKKILVDSDALIGLIHEDDALHKRCLHIGNYIAKNHFTVITPYPIILEAATALSKDKTINRSDLSAQLLKDYAAVEESFIDSVGVSELVAELYHPKTSKKNSPFDFYLLALAKQNTIDTIFSFDAFYKQNGLILVEALLSK